MTAQILDISWKTIVKIFVAGIIFYALYLVKDVVLWFFFALIISVLLEPAINFLRWFRIPKIVAIALVYLSIFGFLGLFIYLTAPIFVFELKQFSQYIPDYFEKISPILRDLGINVAQNFDDFNKILVGGLQQGSKGVINALASFFGGVASAFFILVLAFFLSVEENEVEKFLVLLVPKNYEKYVTALFQKTQKKVAGWFGARILSCLFVGIASFIIFYIFDIKYALLLAFISGVMNFVPYIGPWVTGILLVIFIAVSSNSWLTALYVLIAIIVIQAIENNILTPVLMKKMINLPPILVLIALLVGSQLFGFLGAISPYRFLGLFTNF